jgi:hypothetical protein
MNPTIPQKQRALTQGIKERLDVLTIELDERVNNLKKITQELIDTL